MAKKSITEIPVSLKEPLLLYVIRNSSGQFYRAKGYNSSYKSCWVDDINQAKSYSKIGPARSIVTFFTKNYSGFPQPDLIKLIVREAVIMDETDRVKTTIDKMKRAEAARKIKNAEYNKRLAEERIQKAKKDLEAAEKNLKRLK